MALVQRYTVTTQGAMVLTGNSLVVTANKQYPGGTPYDWTNGAYISTDNSITGGAGYPGGTTLQANQSSSSAILNMPAGSEVLFAQLYWTLSNTSPNQDGNISLLLPSTTIPISISPDLPLKQVIPATVWQTRDVTTIVNVAGSGTYTVSNVSGSTITPEVTSIANAWYLIVVYKNVSLPYRYFNVNTGMSLVQNGSPSDFTFTGFVTPTSGSITGYLLVSSSNGDIEDGAQILVGPSQVLATNIGNTSVTTWNGVAPYAQVNNMLPGMILNADTNDPSISLIDTRGTLGTFNKNPFAGTAPPCSRNNADIFGANISNKLSINQTQLFTRVFYGGSGGGQITNQSVQVDLNSANLGNITKLVDKSYAHTSDTLTYTISFSNTGLADANNVIVMDTIPTGTSFVSGSVSINGVTSLTANPMIPGISLGNIVANQRTTVNFSVIVSSTIPSTNPLINNAQTIYSFVPGVGLATVVSSAISNNVYTTISKAILTSSKIVNKNYAAIGDILTFTIPIINSGSTLANSIIFTDTLPSSITLVSGSFKQDGVVLNTLPNPPGVSISNILAGATSTLTFQGIVNTIPSPNAITNSANIVYSYIIDPTTIPIILNSGSVNTNVTTTTINNSSLSGIIKSCDKSYAQCGDVITFTITIPNSGNTTAFNVILRDTIPTGTVLVPNSVTVNGVTLPGATPQPPTGISVGTIPIGSLAVIRFKTTVSC